MKREDIVKHIDAFNDHSEEPTMDQINAIIAARDIVADNPAEVYVALNPYATKEHYDAGFLGGYIIGALVTSLFWLIAYFMVHYHWGNLL